MEIRDLLLGKYRSEINGFYVEYERLLSCIERVVSKGVLEETAHCVQRKKQFRWNPVKHTVATIF